MSNTLQTEKNLIKELDFQYGDDDGWIREVCEYFLGGFYIFFFIAFDGVVNDFIPSIKPST